MSASKLFCRSFQNKFRANRRRITLGTPLASRHGKDLTLARFLLSALRKSLTINDLRKVGGAAPRLRKALGVNDLAQSNSLAQSWSCCSSQSAHHSAKPGSSSVVTCASACIEFCGSSFSLFIVAIPYRKPASASKLFCRNFHNKFHAN